MRRSPLPHTPIRMLLALALACAAGGHARAQTIAAPPQQRQMPDVVGLASSNALGRLRQLGLSVQTREMPSAQPTGTVIAQTPAAGTPIKQGEGAVLEVSTGQAPQETPNQPAGQAGGDRQSGGVSGGVRVSPGRPGLVPDLTGMSLTLARLRLLTSGLTVGEVDSAWVEGARGGRVVAQDPAAGTQVLPGRRVRVTLARRTPPAAQPESPPAVDLVTVPDLSTLTEAQARAAVGRARLLLGAVDSAGGGTTAAGTVFAQKPAAGATVAPGTFVSVTLTQSARVAMPSLVGRPIAEARRTLALAGLQPGDVTERDNQGAAGRVLAQSIPAGTRVRPGTTVNLSVSRVPVVVRPDTPRAANPPVTPPVQRDTTPPVAQQETAAVPQPAVAETAAAPVAQPVTPVQQPAVPTAQTPVTQTPAARPNPPAPSAAPARAPGVRGVPRQVVWGGIALLLLAIAAGAYRLARRGARRPVQVTAAAPPPVATSARLRVGAGDWESSSQAEGPVQRGRVRLNVRIADPVAAVEPAGAALGPARIAVRTREAQAPAVRTDAAAPVLAGAPVRVQVSDGATELTVDEDTPVILRRR